MNHALVELRGSMLHEVCIWIIKWFANDLLRLLV